MLGCGCWREHFLRQHCFHLPTRIHLRVRRTGEQDSVGSAHGVGDQCREGTADIVCETVMGEENAPSVSGACTIILNVNSTLGRECQNIALNSREKPIEDRFHENIMRLPQNMRFTGNFDLPSNLRFIQRIFSAFLQAHYG